MRHQGSEKTATQPHQQGTRTPRPRLPGDTSSPGAIASAGHEIGDQAAPWPMACHTTLQGRGPRTHRHIHSHSYHTVTHTGRNHHSPGPQVLPEVAGAACSWPQPPPQGTLEDLIQDPRCCLPLRGQLSGTHCRSPGSLRGVMHPRKKGKRPCPAHSWSQGTGPGCWNPSLACVQGFRSCDLL